MQSVMISIRPQWCELIANGQKTIEVRKSRPKLETPFKCYIYCTLSELLTRSHYSGKIYVATNKKYQNALERNGNTTLSGKVIGEFVCNNVDTYDDDTIHAFSHENYTRWNDYDLYQSCIHPEDFEKYAADEWLYGWHISDLIIYDKPKELSEFVKPCNLNCFAPCPYYQGKEYECEKPIITRPPQSWCYVEEKLK